MKFPLDYRDFISDSSPVITMPLSTRWQLYQSPARTSHRRLLATPRSVIRPCRLHEERLHNPFPAWLPRYHRSSGIYRADGFGRCNWLVKTATMSKPNNRGNTTRAAF